MCQPVQSDAHGVGIWTDRLAKGTERFYLVVLQLEQIEAAAL